MQSLDGAAARLLARTHATLAGLGRTLLFTEASSWWDTLTEVGVPRDAFFGDDDFALEYCENALLAKRFPEEHWDTPVELAQCAMFAGLDAAALATLDAVLARRTWSAGQTIIVAGQRSDELFVIVRGSAMVSIPTQEGVARLAVFTPGMAFGEVAFMDHAARTANVTAIDGVECRVLTQERVRAPRARRARDQDPASRESRARADRVPAAGRRRTRRAALKALEAGPSSHADASRRSTSTSSICSGRRWRSA